MILMKILGALAKRLKLKNEIFLFIINSSKDEVIVSYTYQNNEAEDGTLQITIIFE